MAFLILFGGDKQVDKAFVTSTVKFLDRGALSRHGGRQQFAIEPGS